MEAQGGRGTFRIDATSEVAREKHRANTGNIGLERQSL